MMFAKWLVEATSQFDRMLDYLFENPHDEAAAFAWGDLAQEQGDPVIRKMGEFLAAVHAGSDTTSDLSWEVGRSFGHNHGSYGGGFNYEYYTFVVPAGAPTEKTKRYDVRQRNNGLLMRVQKWLGQNTWSAPEEELPSQIKDDVEAHRLVVWYTICRSPAGPWGEKAQKIIWRR